MKKRTRNVEIFSLSALDLFASAMGAFVLLTVIMLPYYFKGKEFEEKIGQLRMRLAQAEAVASAAGRAIADRLSTLEAVETATVVSTTPERKKLAAAEARHRALADKAAELETKVKQTEARLAATPVREPKVKNKVTFRFLGLKTSRDSYLVLVDGSRHIRSDAGNLRSILSGIVSVMGPDKRFAIAFYRYENGALGYSRWPDTGFATGGKDAQAKAGAFVAREYRTMRGTSATFQALKKALDDTADAIILVSDGVIFPPHNEGRSPGQIVSAISAHNRAKTEIHAVAIGRFYKNGDFHGFLRALSKGNYGDFKALPP